MFPGFWVIEFYFFQSDPNINSDPILFNRMNLKGLCVCGEGGGGGQDLCNCIPAQLCLTYIAIYFPLKKVSILD